MKFYRCEHCGNIVIYLKDAGVPVVCCGEEMQELRPGTVDASVETRAVFQLSEHDKVVSAYEYCNLHGLWKA